MSLVNFLTALGVATILLSMICAIWFPFVPHTEYLILGNVYLIMGICLDTHGQIYELKDEIRAHRAALGALQPEG